MSNTPVHYPELFLWKCRLNHSSSEVFVRFLHLLREYRAASSVSLMIPSDSVMSILLEISVSLVVTHSFSDRFNILRQRTNERTNQQLGCLKTQELLSDMSERLPTFLVVIAVVAHGTLCREQRPLLCSRFRSLDSELSVRDCGYSSTRCVGSRYRVDVGIEWKVCCISSRDD